jgi:glycosyltransferase involved in cell wall biosynthesis
MSVVMSAASMCADRGRSPHAEAASDPTHTLPTTVLVSVVIPARNESKNLGWVLRRMPDIVDEVVLVDGHSSDDTVEVARAARPDIVVVPDGGRGKGEAMRTGAAAARGTFIVMLDADGSMDPAELHRFIEPLAAGCEFVKGSRFLPRGGTADMTPLRKFGHRVLLVIANFLFGTRWTDLCYGYCAFSRSGYEDLALDADGFEIETQMAVRAAKLGLRTVEVPSFEYPRRWGNSQLNTFRDGVRVLWTILSERLTRPELARRTRLSKSGGN